MLAITLPYEYKENKLSFYLLGMTRISKFFKQIFFKQYLHRITSAKFKRNYRILIQRYNLMKTQLEKVKLDWENNKKILDSIKSKINFFSIIPSQGW